MARNIVLCCDGTSNEFSQDRTSVIKLFHALVKDPARQAVYYHPGIGTRAPTGLVTRTSQRAGELAGLAFGWRLQDDIVDAYRFVMEAWEPGDQVYIFGFSRGAYTARVIAAMLHLYGVAPRGNDPLAPYAVEMLWAISAARMKPGAEADDRAHSAETQRYFSLAHDFRQTISGRDCAIQFLGVWDTVSSVGWKDSPLMLPYTRANPGVKIVRHGKAIDERRAFFRVNWFGAVEGQDRLEVWFPGVHTDVGGGQPEADSGISKYPLEWMATEAAEAGLLLDDDRLAEVLGKSPGSLYAPASPTATVHNSMTSAWKLAEYVPKKHWNFAAKRWEMRANHGRRRTMGPAPVVHDVAWDIPGYASLPADAVRLSSLANRAAPAILAGSDGIIQSSAADVPHRMGNDTADGGTHG